jgi:hypothetical protein
MYGLLFFSMLLSTLLLIPIMGVLVILVNKDNGVSVLNIKFIALTTSIINLFVSLVIFILFDFSTNQFQFVQEYHEISYFDFYLGVDGLSIYFVLLTTIIIPISLLSNWTSISEDVESYVIIILLLETLLLAVFLVLDILLFYIFFESILPPLFILIGIFGSDNRVKASFYLFLYTLTQQCKRAKHRENPKTLVTKVVREILLPAWLMTQGMVKALEMISIFTLKWTTAVLSHPFIIYKGVKEQRVDGSSKFRNLNFVRCTLIAGKPVFGRTIHSFSHNNGKMFIHTMSNKQNNDNNNLAHPWFVTGLTDADGTFALGFYKSNDYRMGYQIQAIFKIAIHKKDYDVLDAIQKFFGLGKITKHGDTTLQYTVKSLADLQVIISHFDKYPLMSEKRGDFKLFKDGFSLIKTKAHLYREGFHKILSIKAAINADLSDELRLSFPDIKAVNKPLVQNRGIINPNWLAGLTSGDGCFYVSLRNSLTTVSGESVVLKFQIVQHSRDIELIKWLISTLKCGRLELDLKQSAVYFVVTNFKDIFEKIIPLFDKHKIKGVKSWDYEDFKEVAILIQDKNHLSEKGLSNIKSIKSNMNLNRKV